MITPFILFFAILINCIFVITVSEHDRSTSNGSLIIISIITAFCWSLFYYTTCIL